MTVDPRRPTDGARVGDSVDAAFSVVCGGAGSRPTVGGSQSFLFPLSVSLCFFFFLCVFFWSEKC